MQIGNSTIYLKWKLQLKEIRNLPKVIQVKMAQPTPQHKSFICQPGILPLTPSAEMQSEEPGIYLNLETSVIEHWHVDKHPHTSYVQKNIYAKDLLMTTCLSKIKLTLSS